MKKFMFNKVAGFWPGTSQKMNFFIVISRGVFRTLSVCQTSNMEIFAKIIN